MFQFTVLHFMVCAPLRGRFETLSDTLFGTLGRQAPGDSLETLLGFPGPEGPGDSCKGRAGLQSKTVKTYQDHVYLNSVQQMVSGELAGEGLQTGFSRHGLPPQRALLDTVYPLREHLNSVQRMVSGGYCEGSFPDTVCWTRLRNTWQELVWQGC